MAYKMTHPNSKAELEVEAEHVAMYASQGWETSPHAKDPAEPAEAADAPKKKK